MQKIAFVKNMAYPFMKILPTRVFNSHKDGSSVRYVLSMHYG